MTDLKFPVVFIDLEASGLNNGYPIEVGFAVVEEDLSVRTDSRLIKPRRSWLANPLRWDPLAQDVHHLSIDKLMSEGSPASKVAEWLDSELRGLTSYSDAPVHDWNWVRQLYVDRKPAFKMRDIASVFRASEISDLGYQHGVKTAKLTAPKNHRAADDAAHYAVMLLAALRYGQRGKDKD